MAIKYKVRAICMKKNGISVEITKVFELNHPETHACLKRRFHEELSLDFITVNLLEVKDCPYE